ncbi:MAG: zinc-ribbon domain-containing protein [Oscillospiraceae bacterium]|jgi:RNA polymerase subunit RPABC4/transcription elongation factor Spt4|nr:zinc-ribbon domain-containing protein [Oscillospiraceae bacterium]
MYCSKCGSKINDGVNICPECGQPTNAPERSPVQNTVVINFGESDVRLYIAIAINIAAAIMFVLNWFSISGLSFAGSLTGLPIDGKDGATVFATFSAINQAVGSAAASGAHIEGLTILRALFVALLIIPVMNIVSAFMLFIKKYRARPVLFAAGIYTLSVGVLFIIFTFIYNAFLTNDASGLASLWMGVSLKTPVYVTVLLGLASIFALPKKSAPSKKHAEVARAKEAHTDSVEQIAKPTDAEQRRRSKAAYKKIVLFVTAGLIIAAIVYVIMEVPLEITTVSLERKPLLTTVSVSNTGNVFAVKTDGTVVTTDESADVSDLWDISAVSAGSAISTEGLGENYYLFLKTDGTVISRCNYNIIPAAGKYNVSDWQDIIAISAGIWHSVGLKSDGTVVATGHNENGECDVSGWSDIVAVSAGFNYTVGLKSNGTVLVAGKFDKRNRNAMSKWRNIVAVASGDRYTIGVKSNGKVVIANAEGAWEWNDIQWREVLKWSDVISAAVGYIPAVGLKSDGTVVISDNEPSLPLPDVSDWSDIVSVAAGQGNIVGLKADGTIAPLPDYGNDEFRKTIREWHGIKLP